MLLRRSLPALALLAAVAAAAPPAGEVEPDTFASPQPLGVLGPDGLSVAGSLDPTSPTGLAPGDIDGYSVTLAADGPLSATVDAAGGNTLLVGLVREDPSGTAFLGAVLGTSPLTFSRPDLVAGPVYRIGVAGFGDGTPLPYTLTIAFSDDLPRWSGEDRTVPVPEVEPDDAAGLSTDLGDFTGLLYASGSLSSAVPPSADEGYPGDTDTFRFRAVLPTPARLVFRAGPGQLRVEFQKLALVGALPMQEAVFGEAGEMLLPALEPGGEYLVQVRADFGPVPVPYTFFLEPVAPPPPEAPEPLDIRRAVLRLGDGGSRSSFAVDAAFEPGLSAGVPPGASFSYSIRGVGEIFTEGLLRMDALGRLWYRAPAGVPGLRYLRVDPFLGKIRLRGRGVDWGDAADPSDPAIPVEVEVGGVRFGGEADGNARGRTLKVR